MEKDFLEKYSKKEKKTNLQLASPRLAAATPRRAAAPPRHELRLGFGVSFSSIFIRARRQVFSFSRWPDTDTGDRSLSVWRIHAHARRPGAAALQPARASIA